MGVLCPAERPGPKLFTLRPDGRTPRGLALPHRGRGVGWGGVDEMQAIDILCATASVDGAST
eukprot:2565649-Prorocentrum_lima.AAC.1